MKLTLSHRLIAATLASAVVAIASSSVGRAATVTCNTVGTCTGDISVTLGTPVPDETNIFLTAATGTSFVGNVGANNGPALVTFTSAQTVDAANGFATFSANPNNSTFGALTMSVPSGFAFSDVSFSTLKNTDLELTAKNGNTVLGTYTISNLGSGLNQFLAVSPLGADWTSLIFGSTSGFSEIKQIQISGLTATPIPGALVMFASVLGAAFCLALHFGGYAGPGRRRFDGGRAGRSLA